MHTYPAANTVAAWKAMVMAYLMSDNSLVREQAAVEGEVSAASAAGPLMVYFAVTYTFDIPSRCCNIGENSVILDSAQLASVIARLS